MQFVLVYNPSCFIMFWVLFVKIATQLHKAALSFLGLEPIDLSFKQAIQAEYNIIWDDIIILSLTIFLKDNI